MNELNLIATKETDIRIWLDITDFSHFAEARNTNVTGIQRVVQNLFNHSDFSNHEVIPVVLDRVPTQVFRTGTAQTQNIMRALATGDLGPEDVYKLWKNLEESRTPVGPKAGDIFVMAGAFWIYKNYDIFARMRRSGVRIVLFVHDLIQIANPEYVSPEANIVFLRSFCDILHSVNFLMTNSHFVRGEVLRFTKDIMNIDVPVKEVLLPSELPEIKSASSIQTSEVTRRLIEKGEYILCVGTLEIRKNHMYLVRIWQELLRRSDITIPNLVFVGKWGWKIEELSSFVRNTPSCSSWLYVLNNVSEYDLRELYDNSLFTAYPSFAEGFGLPVAESLAHGKLCVTSNRTSMPEVGGEFVVLINPDNHDEGVKTFSRLLRDRKIINHYERLIEEKFQAKTWREFCYDFYKEIESFEPSKFDDNGSNSTYGNFTYEPSTVYYFGYQSIQRSERTQRLTKSLRMARVSGWNPADDWGVWSSHRTAKLQFKTNLPGGREVVVRTLVRFDHYPQPTEFRVIVNGEITSFKSLGSGDVLLQCSGVVDDNRVLEIKFDMNMDLDRDVRFPDRFFGLHSVGFAERDNAADRLTLLEEFSVEIARGRTVSEPGRIKASDQTDILRLLLQPQHPQTRGLRARLTLRLARRSARRSLWRKAEHHYRRLMRLGGMGPAQWVQFGHALKEQGKTRAAIIAYRVAQDQDEGKLTDAEKQLELARQSLGPDA